MKIMEQQQEYWNRAKLVSEPHGLPRRENPWPFLGEDVTGPLSNQARGPKNSAANSADEKPPWLGGPAKRREKPPASNKIQCDGANCRRSSDAWPPPPKNNQESKTDHLFLSRGKGHQHKIQGREYDDSDNHIVPTAQKVAAAARMGGPSAGEAARAVRALTERRLLQREARQHEFLKRTQARVAKEHLLKKKAEKEKADGAKLIAVKVSRIQTVHQAASTGVPVQSAAQGEPKSKNFGKGGGNRSGENTQEPFLKKGRNPKPAYGIDCHHSRPRYRCCFEAEGSPMFLMREKRLAEENRIRGQLVG